MIQDWAVCSNDVQHGNKRDDILPPGSSIQVENGKNAAKHLWN